MNMKWIAYVALCFGAIGCRPASRSAIDQACSYWTGTPVPVTASDTAPPPVTRNIRHEVTLPLTDTARGTNWGRVSFLAPFNSEYIAATSLGVTLEVAGALVTPLGPICPGEADGHAVMLTALAHELRLDNAAAPSTGLVLVENRNRRSTSGGSGGDLDFD
jgi:hypothetical protein